MAAASAQKKMQKTKGEPWQLLFQGWKVLRNFSKATTQKTQGKDQGSICLSGPKQLDHHGKKVGKSVF